MATPEITQPDTEVHLAREMSLFSVTMIGVGAMIGAGIFVLTGIAAGVAGPGLILAFGLNGLVTLITAMAYAELGSSFHDAGGGYLWIKEGLPQPNGFISGWMSWFAHAVACSLYALGFGAYFGHVLAEVFGLDISSFPVPLEKILAVVACVLFAYVNFRGASETGKMGNLVTMAKILVIGLFIAFGLAVVAQKVGWRAEFRPFLPRGMSGVFMAMGLTFIAFQGYEVIAQCSEEVVRPKRNIPRAIFLALLIVIPIYLLVSFTALAAISGNGVPTWAFLGAKQEIAMVDAARQFLPGGAVIFLVGGLLSTLSALNATIYSSSRVAFAMARDANLPDFLARIHHAKRTPHLAIIASAVIVIGMALSLPIEDVASAADVMFLFVFMQVNVAVIRLRRTRPDLDRGFRVPLLPVLPILGILTQLFIAYYLFRYSPKAVLTAAGWIAVGMAMHYLYASKKEAAVVEYKEAVERLARKDYRILVALREETDVRPLMGVALAMARHNDAEIVALAVVEVPFQTPLDSARGLPEVGQKRAILRLAEHMADDAKVPCRRLVKITHRLSLGILETAREEKCNFLLLGRSPRPRFGSRLVRTTMDQVLENAPCHVAVVKLQPVTEVRRVTAFIEEGPDSRLALELLPAFAGAWNAPSRVVAFVPDGAPTKERGRALVKRLDGGSADLLDAWGVEALPGVPTSERILAASGEGDLILMAETPASMVSRLLSLGTPDVVAERSPGMVILTRAHRPRRKQSLLVRILTGS